MAAGWRVVNMQPLGNGGNGDLFVGERSDGGGRVVIKFLRDFWNADNRRWFEREIKIMKRGLHRVVGLLAGDPKAERPYYVMPYFPLGALARFSGQLNHQQLWAVGLQIAEALAAMHDQNIAHGDVKPDNVLVGADGNVQVADPLGNGGGCTVLYTVNCGGTPGYWAPEVRGGGPISKAGDVYSFAATLFHLATGIRPADDQTLDPWLVASHVPEELRKIIIACGAPNPADRPSMNTVLHCFRLRKHVAVSPSTVGQRWVRSAAAAAIIIVIAVTIATVVAAVFDGLTKDE